MRSRLEAHGLLPVVVGVVGQIGLGQHHHRLHTRIHGQRQIAFHPGQVELLVAGADEEHHIHVGGNELHVTRLVDAHAFEQALPLQQTLNGAAFRIEQHPVANGGPIFR